MASLKQIEANRLNARKSTGPRSEQGKGRSRQNAIRHGLTAETLITALEDATEYQIFEASIVADYQPRSATESVMVGRLASLLWRLRRSTSIETGLFQIQGELMQHGSLGSVGRKAIPTPEWYDELDTMPSKDISDPNPNSAQTMAYCFLRVSRLGYGAFDLLNRYETSLWRQAAQLLFMLQSATRR